MFSYHPETLKLGSRWSRECRFYLDYSLRLQRDMSVQTKHRNSAGKKKFNLKKKGSLFKGKDPDWSKKKNFPTLSPFLNFNPNCKSIENAIDGENPHFISNQHFCPFCSPATRMLLVMYCTVFYKCCSCRAKYQICLYNVQQNNIWVGYSSSSCMGCVI